MLVMVRFVFDVTRQRLPLLESLHDPTLIGITPPRELELTANTQ